MYDIWQVRQLGKTMTPDWQHWPGFQFVFFDCDSTLSEIEGIDELARKKGKFAAVKKLTDAAMDGEVHLESVYDHRLTMLNPTRAEIRQLEAHYRQTVVPDTRAVIQALQFAAKEVFIISGGLEAAVRPFGMWLGVPPQNIRAVPLRFDSLSGEWWDYQQDMWGPRPDVAYLNPEDTPLIETHGKAAVVRELLAGRLGRAVLIGDGVSDLAARPALDMVIGFGGVIVRQRVAEEADIYIKKLSLASVFPLMLSSREQTLYLDSPHADLLRKGWHQIQNEDVIFNYVRR